MRTALALVAVLAVAGCDRATEPAARMPDADAAAADTRPAPPASPSRSIGAVSGLAGQTSSLTGDISGFLVSRTGTATVVTLAADTLFEFDKADLLPGAIPNLQRTAELVRVGGTGPIVVTGHTDAKGDDAYNVALSERRAARVVAWLREQPALAARAYTIVGKGESSPAVPNTRADGSDDPANRARNRRVEVAIPR